MVVIPKENAGDLKEIMERFPGSRITTKQCQLFGKSYLSLQSSNLDLLIYVSNLYRENQNPDIARL